MKIRQLARRSGDALVAVWPPHWTSVYHAGDRFAIWDEGVLSSVGFFGNRLTLAMIYEGREHFGALEWDAPPALDVVVKVLKASIGRPIKVIGNLEVP